MAATPSTMVTLGTTATDFTLPNVVTGIEESFTELKGIRATVIMFICNHCPYVKHINEELVKVARHYGVKQVGFIAISSNDVTNYPEDSPELMKKVANEIGYPFPYLYDETQAVAKIYDAACTPDFFVYDESLRLIYRGQFDDSRPGNNKPVTGSDIRRVLDCVLQGKPIPQDQKPSIGCGIKWKK